MAKDSRSPPALRAGALLDYAGLREGARLAVERDGRTQSEIARALDKKPQAIWNALNMEGAAVEKLQLEIIERIGGYTASGPLYRLARA